MAVTEYVLLPGAAAPAYAVQPLFMLRGAVSPCIVDKQKAFRLPAWSIEAQECHSGLATSWPSSP